MVALEAALTVMVALAIVVGLQLVGVILMVAMLIAPAAAARQWVRSLGGMVVLAAFFGMISGVSGAMISASGRGLATGPLVVLIASCDRADLDPAGTASRTGAALARCTPPKARTRGTARA